MPNIIISQFFANPYNLPSNISPIASLVDKDGTEIPLQGLNISTIEKYIASHNLTLVNNTTNNTLPLNNSFYSNPISNVIDYISHFHIFSEVMQIFSNIENYFGIHYQHEL
jgi:hypothetical protein